MTKTKMSHFVSITGCIPPNYGDNCSQVCDCGPGVDRCDPVSGCVCLSGWMGDRCDQDVNECTENPAICGTDKICQNLQGSHRCDCRSGFEKIGEDCKGKKKYSTNWGMRFKCKFVHIYLIYSADVQMTFANQPYLASVTCYVSQCFWGNFRGIHFNV